MLYIKEWHVYNCLFLIQPPNVRTYAARFYVHSSQNKTITSCITEVPKVLNKRTILPKVRWS